MAILELDHRLTFWLYGFGTSRGMQDLTFVIGSIFIYALPVMLVIMFFWGKKQRMDSIKIALIALIAWKVLSALIGSYLYSKYGFRDRPFSERGIVELLFERPTKAFPSDHAAVLAAVAFALWVYRYPKLAWTFLIGGILSSLCRVIIGFHFVGDILAGWLIGVLTSWAVWKMDQRLNWILEKIPFLGGNEPTKNS